LKKLEDRVTTDGQSDILNKNYDELEEDKKEKLLTIGEKLLDIQKLVKNDDIKREKVIKINKF